MAKQRITVELEYDSGSHDRHKLKRFLKWALRAWGLKCTDLRDSRPPISGVIEDIAPERKKRHTGQIKKVGF